MSLELLTVGHGTLTQPELEALLEGAGVTRVVDVRRFPGSRRHPHVGRDALEQWLPAAGVDYVWEPRLGGRRRLEDGVSPDVWWQVEAFRAYAGYQRTSEFAAGFARLGALAAERRTAVMCSEAVWWRCHRRLVADHAVALAGWRVDHLGHDGRLTPHPLAAGARVDDGRLVYDRVPPGPDGADPGRA